MHAHPCAHTLMISLLFSVFVPYFCLYHLAILSHPYFVFIHNFSIHLLVKILNVFNFCVQSSLWNFLVQVSVRERESHCSGSHFQARPVTRHFCVWILSAKWLRTDWHQKTCLVKALELLLHFQMLTSSYCINFIKLDFLKMGCIYLSLDLFFWPIQYFRKINWMHVVLLDTCILDGSQ